MTGSIPLDAWKAAWDSFADCLTLCSQNATARVQECMGANQDLRPPCSKVVDAERWTCMLGCGFRFVVEVNQYNSERAMQVIAGWKNELLAAVQQQLDNAGFMASWYDGCSVVAASLGGILCTAAQLSVPLGLSDAMVSSFAFVGLALLVDGVLFYLVARYFSSLTSQVESRSDSNQSEPSRWARLEHLSEQLFGEPQYDFIRVGASAFQLTRAMPSLVRSLGRIDGLTAASGLSLEEIIGDGLQQVLDIQRASMAGIWRP
jgi:hypothetical protein